MIFKIPAGVVPDNIGIGVGATYALAQNMNAYSANYVMANVGSNTTYTLTAAQIARGVIALDGSPASAVTITTDTAENIVTALGNTIPAGGTFYKPVRFLNSLAQQITIDGGTGVTISGTNTIAAADWRDYLLQVTNEGGVQTANLINMGSGVV